VNLLRHVNFLILPMVLSFCPCAAAETEATEADQEQLKREASKQIASAAAAMYDTEPELVEVRLSDRRLVLPNCAVALQVTFPFNDRATAQLDCIEPSWRGFVQIRLNAGNPIFVYHGARPEGHTLLRSDVKRVYVSEAAVPENAVLILEDVLDKPLLSAVGPGEPVQEDHFGVIPPSNQTDGGEGVKFGWTSTIVIPRGNRLTKSSFRQEILSGRIPTDVIPTDIDFELLEATRNIMPGEVLRQSAVKLAAAVKKGQELPIIIVKGALTVTNTVRVLQDAAIGDAIDAVNVESGRNLKVKVVGIGQVELM
jgi:flagella basal body P-ring formation protein FlgA